MLSWESPNGDASNSSRSPRQITTNSSNTPPGGLEHDERVNNYNHKAPEELELPGLTFLGHQDERISPGSINFDKREHLPPLSMSFRHPSSVDAVTSSSSNRPMHHRVDSLPLIHSYHREQLYDQPRHHPSPPPITTLSRSPSLSTSSLDRSAETNSSRRSPPRDSVQSTSMYSHYSPPGQSHMNQQHPSRPMHHDAFASRSAPPPTNQSSFSYSPQPSFDHRYHPSDTSHSTGYQIPPPGYSGPTMSSIPHPHLPSVRDGYNLAYPLLPQQGPGQRGHSIVLTDDAATKLSDRVRRRCFNCCSSETSTWRRSTLSPGKVLCNKCGLFERTHSRPRPEQFPHKRGPLASSSLRSRTPSSTSTSPQIQTLPPISTPPPSHMHPQSQSQQLLPPFNYHPSIPPLAGVPESRNSNSNTTLPEIQSWLNEPITSSTPHSHSPPMRQQTIDAGSHGRQPPSPPPSTRTQDPSHHDTRRSPK